MLAVAVAAFGFGAFFAAPATPAVGASSKAPAGLLCSAYAGIPADGELAGMVHIPAGRFMMGSERHYDEELTPHEVEVDAFWMDRHDVTNAQFSRFVQATGYRTLAERGRDAKRYRELPSELHAPGSVVFVQGPGGQAGVWRFVEGADWRHPEGPGSSIAERANHPVVHIAYEDAQAYARWLGRELPTEAQWEYAARGGLDGAPYVWGHEFRPQGQIMANTWQGRFPQHDAGEDGYAGTSPVGCFASNGWGLYDMAGNVWQWTASWYSPRHPAGAQRNPAGPAEDDSADPAQPGVKARVIKGGSHLCAPNYCMRYRPSARQPRDIAFGTSHLGFRTVINPEPTRRN
ncbi:formylglycine-generating enzyme family protein [Caldimonas tepidiphila]|uniref:formylglycine-generating enzyme family protein n=1 Tax=Caldimonas tepidiphila TaxID=2315841 RepID=UPI000E5BBB77|nr:formylglycine-generating enzyme family protein [Caldimonas tepidiphila]